MGPMMGPPVNDKYKEPLPKNLRELPGFLKREVCQFFSRLFYIFRLVWDSAPWIMLLLTLISVLTGLLPVLTAYVAAQLINALAAAFTAALASQPVAFGEITGLLILQFVCIFAKSFLTHCNTAVTRVSGELVVNHVKLMMMEKAKTVDLQSFDKPDFYERLENAGREAGMRPIQILNAAFTTVSTVISMVSFVAILFAISPAAPFLIILLSVPSAIVSFVYRKKTFRYVRRRSKDRRQLNYYSDLMIHKDMVKEIRMFGLSDSFIDRYREIFRKYFKGLKSLYVREGVWNISVSLVSSLVNCLLFLYVARKVWMGELMVGDYSLYTGALNSIASGVNSLISATSTIYEGTLFIDNLITFMNEESTVVPKADPPLAVRRHTPHKIELINLSFRYPGSRRYVLHGINAVIEPGSTIALVGLNGAGKTTLIKLITRLYDPTEGQILLDGQDIRDYDTKELYRLFGIIFQDFGKYAVSVGENIAFGDVEREPDAEQIRKAAHQSDADTFIEKLPNGYQTALQRYFEEDGIELSIGQWQKLSIARAFYSDSDILILDEPTASLDALAEQEIFSQFDRLRQDKTTIFVSHRLSSATTADCIWVIDGGELIEQGSHAELMAEKGVYYKLFTTQADRYVEQSKTTDEKGSNEPCTH